MASALTILFLGCWLAGQSGVSGEGTNLAETQESNPPSTEPEKEEGNNSPETDPHLMDSEGKDAGSSPAPGTNLSQPGATPTPAHPEGTGPGTESGGRKSTSMPPETEGTNPAGPQQLDLHTTEPEGEGRPDFTRANITRLVLGAGVLLVLGLILAEACYSRPRGAP